METCEVEAADLRSCNGVFCAMLPDDPRCAVPPLVAECGPDSSDLPPYDRVCSGEGGCGLFFHQVDCCGTTVAAAYAVRVMRQVIDAEEMCRAMMPACGCAPGPLQDEDGAIVGPGETVTAMCVAGMCRALRE